MTYEDTTLELARLSREAIERVRNKMAARQLGEAFVDLFTAEQESEKCVLAK